MKRKVKSLVLKRMKIAYIRKDIRLIYEYDIISWL